MRGRGPAIADSSGRAGPGLRGRARLGPGYVSRAIAGRVVMAGHEVARRQLDKGGTTPSHRPAMATGQRGWKAQPAGRRRGVGRLARRRPAAAASRFAGSGSGHRREQRLACTGAAGPSTSVARRRQLHHPAGVHDRDPVGEVARAREVVGDGQAASAPRASWSSRSSARISARLDASIIDTGSSATR